MKILSIETSCDETASAIISKNPQENYVKILSNVDASSLMLHAKTGGIIPEIAAREQVKYIIPVIKKAIEDSRLEIENLDAIAVTVGPGLIGSLLVGVETAKTLAYLWNKPIIPVNHLLGHIYANWLTTKDQRLKTISFPALALIVSGGHTDLLFMKKHNDFKWLGGTRDDAAGEAFDKIGRLLNFPYPAGPTIEKVSEQGIPNKFIFPRPMIGSKDFNFSFSGLKSAVSREVLRLGKLNKQQVADIALASQESIIGVLVRKTVKAAKKYNVKSILLGGGVVANQNLRDHLELEIRNLTRLPDGQELEIKLFAPSKSLCTDNAAMIGAYAGFNYKPTQWYNITANPQLYFYGPNNN